MGYVTPPTCSCRATTTILGISSHFLLPFIYEHFHEPSYTSYNQGNVTHHNGNVTHDYGNVTQLHLFRKLFTLI